MPILKNAKKALRVSKRHQVVNHRVKSRLKTSFDALKKSQKAEDLPKTYTAIDKAVKKNIIHKNKAARLKSQASKKIAAK